MDNRYQQNLTQGNVFRQLLLFSIPFVFSTLLQSVYSMVDMMIVGQFVGSSALSAVSLSSQIIQMITFMCVGFATAGQIYIAQCAGAGRKDMIKSIVGTLLIMILALSVALTAVSVGLNKQLLNLIQTPAEAMADAQIYLYICGGCMVFTALYNMLAAILRGMGDSRHPFIFIAIASVLNIILDYVFVAIAGWGTAGAAWATIIGQVVSVICCTVFIYRRREQFSLSFEAAVLKPDGAIFKILIRLGIPLLLSGSAISISSLFVSSLVNRLGVAASAAFGAGQKLQTIPSIITQSVGYGVSAMAAQNLGAQKYDRVRQVIWSALGITCAACAICGAVFYLYPKEVFSLFTTDPDVLAIAPLFMVTLCISMPATAMMSPFNNLINAAGDANLALAIAIADGFFARIAFSYVLGNMFGMGITGYFLGNALAPYLTAVPGLVYFLCGKWEKASLVN